MYCYNNMFMLLPSTVIIIWSRNSLHSTTNKLLMKWMESLNQINEMFWLMMEWIHLNLLLWVIAFAILLHSIIINSISFIKKHKLNWIEFGNEQSEWRGRIHFKFNYALPAAAASSISFNQINWFMNQFIWMKRNDVAQPAINLI